MLERNKVQDIRILILTGKKLEADRVLRKFLDEKPPEDVLNEMKKYHEITKMKSFLDFVKQKTD